MSELVIGGLTGVAFGALLQQGRVLRFEKQVGAMLFRDMTILKFMLSAIVVGMVGLYVLEALDVIAFSPKSTSVGANLIGGLLFGAGWAIVGYCPGTAMGAVGEGRWHAVWALLGMLVGAAIFAEAYPALKSSVATWGAYGKIQLPDVLGVSPWIVIVVFIVAVLLLFRLFEKRSI
jgi:uncharacterized membrane protein YedE/YeeE